MLAVARERTITVAKLTEEVLTAYLDSVAAEVAAREK